MQILAFHASAYRSLRKQPQNMFCFDSSVVSAFNSSASSPKHTWDREPSLVVICLLLFFLCQCVCEEVSPDVVVSVFGLDEGSSRSAKDSPVGGGEEKLR